MFMVHGKCLSGLFLFLFFFFHTYCPSSSYIISLAYLKEKKKKKKTIEKVEEDSFKSCQEFKSVAYLI